MATHSNILAWKIAWTEEPGRLQSMGSQRVRHDWVTKHSTAHLDAWRVWRKLWVTDKWNEPKWGFLAFSTLMHCADKSQCCCCCCCVASVMSDSVRPHRRQPIRLPRPWDSPGKNTGVGCRFLLWCMKVKSESEVAQSCPTLATPGFKRFGLVNSNTVFRRSTR